MNSPLLSSTPLRTSHERIGELAEMAKRRGAGNDSRYIPDGTWSDEEIAIYDLFRRLFWSGYAQAEADLAPATASDKEDLDWGLMASILV